MWNYERISHPQGQGADRTDYGGLDMTIAEQTEQGGPDSLIEKPRPKELYVSSDALVAPDTLSQWTDTPVRSVEMIPLPGGMSKAAPD